MPKEPLSLSEYREKLLSQAKLAKNIELYGVRVGRKPSKFKLPEPKKLSRVLKRKKPKFVKKTLRTSKLEDMLRKSGLSEKEIGKLRRKNKS